jgi:multisubunit Na+/H+ antiporter MnhE subunit
MNLGINLLLALLWASIIGPFSPANSRRGFVLGYIVLRRRRGTAAARVRAGTSSQRSGSRLFTMVANIVANIRSRGTRSRA